MYQLKLDPQIKAQFPNYTALIIYAHNLHNQPSDEATLAALRSIENEKRAEFGEEKPTTHPHIAAWREAYKAFGMKPSKYPCSIEALLNRVLKGQDLPSINQIVDIYNIISLKYVLPVGGEDLDQLTSDLMLKPAIGNEPFEVMQEGISTITYPEKGEIIWVDNSGVTCRAWNWRQGYRTRLTLDTTNAYFVLDCLPPFSLATLQQAGQELIGQLKATSPGCEITQELLGNP